MSEVPFELDALSRAKRYQRWIMRSIQPFLGNRILEVGAGIGNMSRWLPVRERLLLSEEDPAMRARLAAEVTGPGVSVVELDLANLANGELGRENIDTIVSFNVLEHVPDDRELVASLCRVLRESKAPGVRRLVSFVPAHPWASGEIDRIHGHRRRYERAHWRALRSACAPESRLVARYFNAFGLVGWTFFGRVMGSPTIGDSKIRAFEALCPFLSPIDDLLHEKLDLPVGQSLIAVLEWPRE